MSKYFGFRALALVAVVLSSACVSTSPPTYSYAAMDSLRSEVAAVVDSEAGRSMGDFPERSIGVLPLSVSSDDDELAPLGFGLAELLMSDLARSAQLQVVDRLRIHALMQELSLRGEGVVTADGGPEQGRVLAARHLVTGSLLATEPSSIRVNANLVRTEDATVRHAVSASTQLDDILEAETQLALEVFEAMDVTLTPAEREAVVRRPTRDLAALLAFSRGVRAEMQGELSMALREYRHAAQLDGGFVEARERLDALERNFPDVDVLAMLLIDLVNRPGVPGISDVTEPASGTGQFAGLVIPITIR